MSVFSEKDRKAVPSVRKLILYRMRTRVIQMGTLRAVLWVTGTAEAMAIALGWVLIRLMGYSAEAGRAVYLATSTIPLIIAPIVGGTVVLLLEDLEVARQALQEISMRDGLTSLFNRTYFMERMRREVSYAERYELPLSLLFFDADDFKRINDRYGHSVGDLVLESIAQTCTTLLREHDVLARYGGEEFVLLLPATAAEGACQVAEKLRAALEDMRVKAVGAEAAIRITVSVGVSSWRDSQETADTLFARADQALYRAKLAGKNRWVAL